MDNGRGRFEELPDATPGMLQAAIRKHGTRTLKKSGIFTTGEELEIRGSFFRLMQIMKHTLILRLLPRRSLQLEREFCRESGEGMKTKAGILDVLLRDVFRSRGETFPLTDDEVIRFSEKVDAAFIKQEALVGEEQIKGFIGQVERREGMHPDEEVREDAVEETESDGQEEEEKTEGEGKASDGQEPEACPEEAEDSEPCTSEEPEVADSSPGEEDAEGGDEKV